MSSPAWSLDKCIVIRIDLSPVLSLVSIMSFLMGSNLNACITIHTILLMKETKQRSLKPCVFGKSC